MPGERAAPLTSRARRVPLARISLRAEPAGVRDALARTRAALARADPAPECVDDVELVLAEVLNNIVTHAYARHPGPIEVDLDLDPEGLACEVRDHGRAMPDEAPPAGMPVRLDVDMAALPEGGFGWFLIRRHAHSLRYVREGGVNRLSLLLPLYRPA